ncbi:malate dehydrogenase, NAD-dependent [Basidiobolus meristosporus CBS 931.73]|uniref:malate dehydrogenase n=1 Tax=Basidiobolus meristosporus CBS 931.73 TaxID=1314790 RepID=A0A1Y1YFF6_9FUNG|nr:malate dehydrogenase, NAD-dependent [Basidiobolus meristosporus CBS 931.73]|eukprot:ORX96742.1 malate dehydrogenase, NAD-dependent [Basidiobolus meristosporus CBS 931.73]
MFASRQLISLPRRAFSTSIAANATKVAVLGAAGGIGQPLSLILKQSTLIDHLSLYDIVNTPGVAADLSHINTPSKVTGHVPENDGLKEALSDANVVVIPAGVPRKPGMTRDDLFTTNASIVRDLAAAAAQHCPDAHILVVSNPVNSTVPIVSEVFKKAGVYNPRKIFGVSTLDVVRASRFVYEIRKDFDPSTPISVIGGHSGTTIIPILSRVKTSQKLTQEEVEAVTHRIQFGGDEVVKAKAGAGSATLSMAHAGARFALDLLNATVTGKSGIVTPAFVSLEADPEGGKIVKGESDNCDFFAANIEFGVEGVKKINPVGEISGFERKLLDEAIPQLKTNIKRGVDFVNA